MRDEGKTIRAQRPLASNSVNWRANRHAQVSPYSGWFLKISIIILIACIAWWIILKLRDPLLFPIRNVHVEGSYIHVNRQALRSAIVPFSKTGFWGVDKNALQERLAQLPWIESVTIHRVLPSTLQITLTEQHPVARFNNEQLLNDKGELFSVPTETIPANLPWFIGPVGQQNTLSDAYRAMSAVLKPLNLTIIALALSERQSWRLQLNNGIVILIGRVDPLLRLQRLVTVYPQIFTGKVNSVDTIDLCYSHGIAVRYKPIS